MPASFGVTYWRKTEEIDMDLGWAAKAFAWHPNRALSDEDRTLRVTRLQQINAAWEILSRKHSA